MRIEAMNSTCGSKLLSGGLLFISLWLCSNSTASGGAEFEPVPGFDEQIRWSRLSSGVRVFVNRPLEWKTSRRTLVIYATPNGNTIEQTLGCAADPNLDFRFDIQHVAAQIRRWREVTPKQDTVYSVVQAPQLSWPAFRAEQAGSGQIIRDLVTALTEEFKADRVILAGHSGGGSFQFGYISSVDGIPPVIERIVLLDANYSYSNELHAEKILRWLRGDDARKLIVIAYDDREITLNGKKVVGPEGGTYRASQRMINRFREDFPLPERETGPFHHSSGLDGRVHFFIHPNPENKILHTALVGEMNGLLLGLALGTDQATTWGQFGGPRAYIKSVQRDPFREPRPQRATLLSDVQAEPLAIPARSVDAPTGSQFKQQIVAMPRQEREAAVLRQILDGNVPESLRKLSVIRVEFVDQGARHVAEYAVMPDYLAIGSDADFFRIPITPASAMAIADNFQATLITTKISDDVFAVAPIKLAPRPLTKDRDLVESFYQHHQIIQEQLRGKTAGSLIAGIKKDVVISNRLQEKPHRVAIFGWHNPDGRPIQPLYVGHVDWYVDYSHGVRLMSNRVVINGEPMMARDVLQHPLYHRFLSDEGPIDVLAVKRAAAW